MSLILTQPITGPSAWKAADLANSDAWIYRLSPDAIATLDAALASVKARGLSFPGFGTAAWFVVWALLFGAQMAFSRWWLSRYRFGPMEWLWRWMTYGARQPMRLPAIA